MTGRTSRRTPLSAALLLCAALGAGCVTAPRFQVTDIAITSSTPEATILEVSLLGTNATADPLKLYEVRYSMSIDGKAIASARRSPEATLPAKGSQAFRFPVAVPTSVADSQRLAASAYHVSGSVTYEIPGTIAQLFFDSNIQRPTQGFSENGSFAPEGPAPSPAQEPAPAN